MAQIAAKAIDATVDRMARRTRLKLNDPFLPEPHKRLGRFFGFTPYLKKNIRLTKQTIPLQDLVSLAVIADATNLQKRGNYGRRNCGA